MYIQKYVVFLDVVRYKYLKKVPNALRCKISFGSKPEWAGPIRGLPFPIMYFVSCSSLRVHTCVYIRLILRAIVVDKAAQRFVLRITQSKELFVLEKIAIALRQMLILVDQCFEP